MLLEPGAPANLSEEVRESSTTEIAVNLHLKEGCVSWEKEVEGMLGRGLDIEGSETLRSPVRKEGEARAG